MWSFLFLRLKCLTKIKNSVMISITLKKNKLFVLLEGCHYYYYNFGEILFKGFYAIALVKGIKANIIIYNYDNI